MRTTACLTILLALIAAPIRTARAEDTPGKAAFERANRYFLAGEYDAALRYYNQAYQLSGKRPSTIRALAQCERALKRYDDAIVHLREYLSSDPEDAPKIRETLALLQELRAEAEVPSTPEVAPAPPQPTIAPEPRSPADPTRTTPGPPGLVVGSTDLNRLSVDSRPPPPESSGLETSSVFWILAGVVAVGGGIGLALALSGSESAYGGTTGIVLIR